ncbi:hypothetical protein HK100_003756 [Physocladia obscura]|uniref:PARP catalytic domain-containing protein n=1 Tax=Physocladia obscura TaxID=109957 RepID=A0AAD5STL7_9FUNG|nr:hypothetical protein HK100_003756 [Physocladia obscura]
MDRLLEQEFEGLCATWEEFSWTESVGTERIVRAWGVFRSKDNAAAQVAFEIDTGAETNLSESESEEAAAMKLVAAMRVRVTNVDGLAAGAVASLSHAALAALAQAQAPNQSKALIQAARSFPATTATTHSAIVPLHTVSSTVFAVGEAVRALLADMHAAKSSRPELHLSSDQFALPLVPPVSELSVLAPLTAGARSRLVPAAPLATVVDAALKHAREAAVNANATMFHHQPIIATKKVLERWVAKHRHFLALDKKDVGRDDVGFLDDRSAIRQADVYLPTFAFHSTCSKDFIPSIIESSLIPAGNFTDDGIYIPEVHGSFYGKGIYVSPSFKFASEYGFSDNLENRQIVVCLVLPGRIKRIRKPHHGDKDYMKQFYCKIYNKTIEFEFNSHIVDNEQYVLNEADQVLPVLLVSYFRNHGLAGKQEAQIAAKVNSELLRELDIQDEYYFKPRSKKNNDSSGSVIKARLLTPLSSSRSSKNATSIQEKQNQYYSITIPSDIIASNKMDSEKIETHLIFLIDTPPPPPPQPPPPSDTATAAAAKIKQFQQFSQLVLPSCAHIHRKLAPTLARTDVVVFSSHGRAAVTVAHGVTNAAWFASQSAINTLAGLDSSSSDAVIDGSNGFIAGYTAALEIALRQHERRQRERQDDVLERFDNDAVAAAADQQRGSSAATDRAVTTVMDAEAWKERWENASKGKRDAWIEKYGASVAPAPLTTITTTEQDEKAAQNFQAKANVVLKRAEKERRQTVFVFVFVSAGTAGNEKVDEMKLDKVLSKYNGIVRGAGLRTIFKMIGIGKKSNPTLGLKANMATQTLYESAFRSPVYPCTKIHEIPIVAMTLGNHVSEFISCASIKIPSLHVLNGIIVKWTAPPVNTTFITFPATSDNSNSRVTLLFKGSPPATLTLNGIRHVKIEIVTPSTGATGKEEEKEEEEEDEDGDSRIVELLREMLIDVKVAVITKRDYIKPVNELVSLITACKTAWQARTARAFARIKDTKTENINGNNNNGPVKGVERVRIMHAIQRKKGLVTDLETILNELKVDFRASESRLSCEDAAKWLAPVRSMKFAKAVVKRTVDSVITEQLLNADHEKAREWVKDHCSELANGSEREETEYFISCQSGLSEIDQIKDFAAINTKGFSVSDFLYCCGITGLGIHIFRSQAAIASPWQIIVTYVSPEFVDTASSMCYLNSGMQWTDVNSRHTEVVKNADIKAQDVLIIANPQNDEPYKFFVSLNLFKAYTSIQFSRNPDLYLGQQRIAILGVAFVRALEQLYHPPSEMAQNPEHRAVAIKNLFSIVFTIRKSDKSYKDVCTQFLSNLMKPQPSQYLTEADTGIEDPNVLGSTATTGVMSVAQVLVALCCFACFEPPTTPNKRQQADNILYTENKEQLSEPALAILAESVSRGCRIQIKSSDSAANGTSTKARELIRKTLSIPSAALDSVDGNVPAPASNEWVTSGKKLSGRFFRNEKWRTNASPQAVAACLAFARWVARYWSEKAWNRTFESVLLDDSSVDRDDMFSALSETVAKDGGMHDFLTLYSKDAEIQDGDVALASKDVLQVALYVQGLRFHDSKSRRLGLNSLVSPLRVVHQIIEEERNLLFQEWVAQKQAKLAALGRENARKLRIELQQRQQVCNFLYSSVCF